MMSKDRVNAWISDPVGGLYYDPYEMTSGDSIIRNLPSPESKSSGLQDTGS